MTILRRLAPRRRRHRRHLSVDPRASPWLRRLDRPLPIEVPSMDGRQHDDAGSSPGLDHRAIGEVTPARAGELFALASVAVDIDGVQVAIHGIRALRGTPVGTRIELPKFQA